MSQNEPENTDVGADLAGRPEFALLAMLVPALKHGCRFELFEEDGVVCVDLNTGAKSECVLKAEDGATIAYRRYGRLDEVNAFDDVLLLVHDCAHGRSYFDSGWLKVFEENDLSDPRGSL